MAVSRLHIPNCNPKLPTAVARRHASWLYSHEPRRHPVLWRTGAYKLSSCLTTTTTKVVRLPGHPINLFPYKGSWSPLLRTTGTAGSANWPCSRLRHVRFPRGGTYHTTYCSPSQDALQTPRLALPQCAHRVHDAPAKHRTHLGLVPQWSPDESVFVNPTCIDHPATWPDSTISLLRGFNI